MGIPAHGDDIIFKTLQEEVEVTGCHRQTGMSPGGRDK